MGEQQMQTKMSFGGRAWRDGITFSTHNYSARVKKLKDGESVVKVKRRSRKEVYVPSDKKAKLKDMILRPDFLLLLLPVLIEFFTTFSVQQFRLNFTDSSIFLAYLLERLKFIVMIAFIFSAMGSLKNTFLLKKLFQHHGAEHKVIMAAREGKELTLENVRASNRISIYCGTVFVTIFFVLNALIFFFVPTASLSFILAYLLAMVVLSTENQSKNPLISFLYQSGLWIQKHCTTLEPTDEQIELGIMGMKKLIEKETALQNSVKEKLQSEMKGENLVLEQAEVKPPTPTPTLPPAATAAQAPVHRMKVQIKSTYQR
jgi:uncharacterized protein YqhQ